MLEEGPGFERQRRNVVVLAIALILFEIAGGEIESERFLGALALANANALHLFAYIALGYFTLRLFQWSKQERSNFHDRFWRELLTRRGLVEHALNWLGQTEPKARNIIADHLHSTSVVPAGLFRRNILLGAEVEIWMEMQAAHGGAKYRNESKTYAGISTFRFPAWRAWVYECRTFARMAITSYEVTEVWLPFALALAAFTVGLVRALS